MSQPPPVTPSWLSASSPRLADDFDVALLDLDGTLFRGSQVIEVAPAVVQALREAGVRPAFVTNNASRPPAAVAAHLTALGVTCDVAEVTTAAQAGAALIADRFPAGTAVLVVGGEGVLEALKEAGLRPVDSASDRPLAVLQGWSPDLSWPALAEGAFALAAGAAWFVTNLDLTLPTDRGIAPGNGSFVALLQAVTKRDPDAVAGKPLPPLLEKASTKLGARRPIVVGDRLDTDIRGAVAASLPSLLVLSGVTDPTALLGAGPGERPTFLSWDVAGLLHQHPAVVRAASGGWSCGRWTAAVQSEAGTPPVDEPYGLQLTRDSGPASSRGHDDDGLDAVRAAAAAAWECADQGSSVRVDGDLLLALDGAAGRSRQQGP